MTTFIWPPLNSAAHSSAGTSFSRGFETDSKGHGARMKKPKKGPRTVTRKSSGRPPKPEAQATRLTPKPKGARARKPQPMLPFWSRNGMAPQSKQGGVSLMFRRGGG